MKAKSTRKCVKIFCICALICVCAVVCVILYYRLLQPYLSLHLFPEPKAYTGVDYHLSEEYQKLEYSNEFDDVLQKLELTDTGKLTDFYYRDNKIRDNPYYGEIPDVYSADFEIDVDSYAAVAEEIKSTLKAQCQMGKYTLYVVPDNFDVEDTDDQPKVIVIALNDSEHILRCMMIVPQENFSTGYITQHTNLDWY